MYSNALFSNGQFAILYYCLVLSLFLGLTFMPFWNNVFIKKAKTLHVHVQVI